MPKPGFLNFVRNIYTGTRRRLQRLRYRSPDDVVQSLRACGAQVGEECIISSPEIHIGIEGYLLKIGNHVTIGSGAAVMTHDGASWVFRHIVPDLQVYGPVVIEEHCFIGQAAMICPNVRIGANSVVAPGSVVINDIPPNSVAMGIPARVIGARKPYSPAARVESIRKLSPAKRCNCKREQLDRSV